MLIRLIVHHVSYTKQIISDLLQNKVDMSQLVITKALAKTGAHISCDMLETWHRLD